jgi:hypothetical protein
MRTPKPHNTIIAVIVMVIALTLLAFNGQDEHYQAPIPEPNDMVRAPDLKTISPELKVVLDGTQEHHRYVYDQRAKQCFLVITHVHQMGITPVDCTTIGWNTYETQHR